MAIYGNRVCKQCGRTFSGGPRAWFCPDCRYERNKEKNRIHHQNGPMRKIGSIDYCVNCGKTYTVTSGLQKYCANCAPLCVAEVDRRQGLDYYYQNKGNINPKRNIKRKSQKKKSLVRFVGRHFSGMKIKSYAPKIAGTKTEKFTAENTKEIIPAERRKQNDG